MRPLRKHPFLVALIALAVIGLSACGSSQPGNDAQDVNVQPVLPTPAIQTTDREPVDFDCANSDSQHTVGTSIAETYEVSYEQVMEWFCDGYSFDNILIALETSEAVNVPADTLLEMLLEKEWEQIWSEMGFLDNP
jgi:hypothetical protein